MLSLEILTLPTTEATFEKINEEDLLELKSRFCVAQHFPIYR